MLLTERERDVCHLVHMYPSGTSPALSETVNYAVWSRATSTVNDDVASTRNKFALSGIHVKTVEMLCLGNIWSSGYILIRKRISGLFCVFIFVIYPISLARSTLCEMRDNGRLFHNFHAMWRLSNTMCYCEWFIWYWLNMHFSRPRYDDRMTESEFHTSMMSEQNYVF